MANQTPEERKLHETIDKYLKSLWDQIGGLERRVTELERHTHLQRVFPTWEPMDTTDTGQRQCLGCSRPLMHNKSCINPTCSMFGGY